MAQGTLSEPQKSTIAGQTALEFPDNRLMIELCGEFDKNLAKIEQQLDVQIIRRGNQLDIFGLNEAKSEAHSVLSSLYER
ncbi:MAG: phosphate starvation-inducible protein PhoH, partial [Rhodobacteraceae bacterium]|nr:phosphate starvation-inducible protein PhoH [Paracoccaceae bacterium]